MPVIPLQSAQKLQQQFQPVREAIARHRARLSGLPDLVAVRPGFRYDANAATPAAVLEFMPPLARVASAIELEYAGILGVPVRVLEASPDEQLRYLASGVHAPLGTSEFERLLQPAVAEFRPPVRGTYQPPPDGPALDEIEEEMELTLATSPDAGWPVLREFLAQPVQHRLQIGIYQFTAPHIYRQLRRTLLADEDARLRITLHPVPEKIRDEGTKADDIFGPDILDRLRRALGSRLQYEWMSVGPRKVFASSYHIKVAVADGRRTWLSSGNWQTSNQPPYDPLKEPDALPARYLTSYNREHHVVLEHRGLASIFERYLQHDLRNGAAEPAEFGVAPDLFVADDAAGAEAFAPPRYFEPLRLKRKVRVQPLLTPDNYAGHVLAMIRSAKESIWFQNQYININPEEGLQEFTDLVEALLERMHAGLDVRIICRDLMKPEKLDLLVALGFEPQCIRFLKNTHTKIIIVDGKQTVIGSHNWSNEGVAANRDASLLFFDGEIAGHCARIFAYDWQRARARTAQRQPRVAREDERPFAGAVRRSWESVFDEMPAPAAAAASTPAPAPRAAPAGRNAWVSFSAPGAADAVPGAEQPLLILGGVDGITGKYLTPPRPLADVAAALRVRRARLLPEVRGAANRSRYRAFGLPFGLDENNLGQVGWAVVVPGGDSRNHLAAVQPLLDRRRTQVPPALFKVLEYRPGEQVRDWLQRHNVAFGNVTPSRIPYHLLLLGGPTEIPFAFQYMLDLEYSVGRLAFDSSGEYARYANSVVRYETGPAPATTRDAAFFAPEHPGDGATKLSRTSLVDPLADGSPTLPKLADQFGFRITRRIGANATRSSLLELLHGAPLRPSLLFTAGHGMGFPVGDEHQALAQGALLTQDWSGAGIKPADYVRAADVTDEAKLHGLVAFLFACYGAGTPEFDAFPQDLGEQPAAIAPEPFVAALPKRLLGHPNGGALGVFGHIERAWGFSITGTTTQPQLVPFWNAFARIMGGACLGNVTKDFNERSALLSAELADSLEPGAAPVSDQELVWRWIERNDARAYILLGDPGARLRSSEIR